MALYGYTFLKEVEKFNIDTYIPHLVWVEARPATLKIYTRIRSISYFLHDEVSDRLYEFSVTPGKKLNNEKEFQNVLKAFMVAFPEHVKRNG